MSLEDLFMPAYRPRQLRPNKALKLNPKAFFTSPNSFPEALLPGKQPSEGILTSLLKSGGISGARFEPQLFCHDKRWIAREPRNSAFDHNVLDSLESPTSYAVQSHYRQRSLDKKTTLPWGTQPSAPTCGPLTASMVSARSLEPPVSLFDQIMGSPLNSDVMPQFDTTLSEDASMYRATELQLAEVHPEILPNPLAIEPNNGEGFNNSSTSSISEISSSSGSSGMGLNVSAPTAPTTDFTSLGSTMSNPKLPVAKRVQLNLTREARLSYKVSKKSRVRLLVRMSTCDLGYMVATESSYRGLMQEMSLHSELEFDRMSRPKRRKKQKKTSRYKIWDLRSSHGFKHKCCVSGCPLQYVGAPSKESLLRHIDSHHLCEGRVCGWCSFVVSRYDVLGRHIKRRHSLEEREQTIMERIAKMKFYLSRNWILQSTRLNPSLRSILKTQLIQGTSLAPSQVGAGTLLADCPSEEEEDDEIESNVEDIEKIQEISAQISEVLPDSGPQAWETKNLPPSLKQFVAREVEASTNAALLLLSSPYADYIRTMMGGTEYGDDIVACEPPAKRRRKGTLQNEQSP